MPPTQPTSRSNAGSSSIRQDRKRRNALHGSKVSHPAQHLTLSGRRCNGVARLSFLSFAASHSCTQPSSPGAVNPYLCVCLADEIRENPAVGSAHPVASRTLLMRYIVARVSANRMRSSGRAYNQHSSSFSANTGSMRDRAAPDRAQDHGFAGLTSRREMGGVSNSEHSAARPVSLFAWVTSGAAAQQTGQADLSCSGFDSPVIHHKSVCVLAITPPRCAQVAGQPYSATVDEAGATYPGRRSDRGVRPLVCGFRGHFSHGDDQRLTARKRTTQGFLIGARAPLPFFMGSGRRHFIHRGKPMRLVQGSGSPTTGACWMSAISHYAGYEWSDHPECVDPVIRQLCIRINDMLPSDIERERVIGPHIMTPVGTAQGVELIRQRAFLCADMAVREWAPIALEKAGQAEGAAELRALPEIVDEASATMAKKAAAAAATAANAANAAAAAANAAATAHAATAAANAAATATHAVKAAYNAATHAVKAAYANAAYNAATNAVKAAHAAEFLLLPLVLRLCAMGERVEVPMVREMSELPLGVPATEAEPVGKWVGGHWVVDPCWTGAK